MQALVVTVPTEQAELASDVLWSLGVVAIEERDGPHGSIELWTSVGEHADAVLAAISAADRPWGVESVMIDDALVDRWRDFIEPIDVTDSVTIVPAWRVPDTAFVNGPDRIVLRIDPGSTFGMGDHPTTLLTAREAIRLGCAGRSVLDVGTGSGVLAVLTMQLGASSAHGIDIAPESVSVGAANAQRNDVKGPITWATMRLAEIGDTFDLVLANILAPVLVDLAADLRRVTSPTGFLVISGVLLDAHAHVLDALAPMRVVNTSALAGWASITLAH